MVALTFFNKSVLHGAAKRGGPILAKLWTVGWRWVGRTRLSYRVCMIFLASPTGFEPGVAAVRGRFPDSETKGPRSVFDLIADAWGYQAVMTVACHRAHTSCRCSAEQFHARTAPNNATRLSGMEWLWSAKRA